MRQLTVLILSAFLLSACNLSSLIELVYSDRIKYTFSDEDDAKQHSYMCKKGESKDDSRQRAEKAHHFMQEGIKNLAQEYAETPSFKDKEGDTMYGDALKKLEDGSEKLVTDIEEQFQCMYVGE